MTQQGNRGILSPFAHSCRLKWRFDERKLTSIDSVSDSRKVLRSGSSCRTGWFAIFCKQFSNALLLDSTKSSANRPELEQTPSSNDISFLSRSPKGENEGKGGDGVEGQLRGRLTSRRVYRVGSGEDVRTERMLLWHGWDDDARVVDLEDLVEPEEVGEPAEDGDV
jgi:hypothetical protein